jgi:hypothetical protein
MLDWRINSSVAATLALESLGEVAASALRVAGRETCTTPICCSAENTTVRHNNYTFQTSTAALLGSELAQTCPESIGGATLHKAMHSTFRMYG